MAFHLIHSDGQALLASDTPLIRAGDQGAVRHAVQLLSAAHALHDEQERRLAEERTRAAADARAAGYKEGRAAFAAAIADLVTQVDDDRDRREEEIGLLALAALRQMVGQLADGELMGGIARRAVEAVGSHGPILVEVSPAMAPAVEEALAPLPTHIDRAVRAEETLADDQCRLTAPDGRIIADAPLQIAAFERRWTVNQDAG